MSELIIAQQLLGGLSLHLDDAARLILEMTEELGESTHRMPRHTLLKTLRRVIRCGTESVRKAEHTVTFGEAARQSIEAREERRPTTRRDLRHYMRRLMRVRGVTLRPLREMDAQECRHILNEAFGDSVNSYRKGRTILHSIFAFGVRREWCDSNPVTLIEAPLVKEKEITPLSLEEVERLEQTANLPEHRAMKLSLHLMLYCGIRPAEIARLRPEDIRQTEHQVIIRPRISKTGGGRVIPLRKGIFCTESDWKIPRNWCRRWRALRRAAGFTRWVPDVLRHTFASYHVRHFQDLPALQLEMGHRDSDLLLTRYINPVGISLSDAELYWRDKEAPPRGTPVTERVTFVSHS